MGKLKTIYLALLNRKQRIARKSEIIGLVGEYNKKIEKISIKNALWYLSRQRYVKRIFLDYYYINSIEERELGTCSYLDKELLFLVLNASKIKWYLGLAYAKYSSGEIWQTPNVLTIINNKISGNKKILGIKVHFIKIKDSLIFGLVSDKTENNIRYSYSDREKTSLDSVYLTGSKEINKGKKTKTYAKKYPKWIQKLI